MKLLVVGSIPTGLSLKVQQLQQLSAFLWLPRRQSPATWVCFARFLKSLQLLRRRRHLHLRFEQDEQDEHDMRRS